jgi:hypothetical protein
VIFRNDEHPALTGLRGSVYNVRSTMICGFTKL